MAEICTVEPTLEPVSLADMKLHLKLDGNEEDSYIESLTTAARRLSERSTGRAYNTQTWQYSFQIRDYSKTVTLPKRKFISVSTLEYYDEVTYAWVAMTTDQYKVITFGESGELLLLEYPGSLYRCTYQAGYGATAVLVPADLRAAIMRRVATMYENRQDVIVGTIFAKMDKDQSVESLEAPYRVTVI